MIETFILVQLMLPDNIQPSWWYLLCVILFEFGVGFFKATNGSKGYKNGSGV